MKQMLIAALLLSAPASAMAQGATEPVTMSKNIQFITGDTWVDNAVTYRLYGVQSCIRGTNAINERGDQFDCGDASIAQTAALFLLSDVACQPVGYALDKATFVVCGVTIKSDTIDLGTAIIASGYGFAATSIKGDPVNDAYLVAEIDAKMNRKGLWEMLFPHPVTTLLRTAPK
jgi:endonuclease YncB( thermonuclease family)